MSLPCTRDSAAAILSERISLLLAPFPLRGCARWQKHSESRPRGNEEIDPFETFPRAPSGKPYEAAFFAALQELGYTEGQNLTVEYRYANIRFEGLPELATELVGLNV